VSYCRAFLKADWLNAATGAATTSGEDVQGARDYGLQMSTTGGPTGGAVILEGSLDGVNWAELASVNIALAGVGPIAVWATGRPVKEIRLRLTGLTGGSSPTLSASAIAA